MIVIMILKEDLRKVKGKEKHKKRKGIGMELTDGGR
jgi:hypothetical protein